MPHLPHSKGSSLRVRGQGVGPSCHLRKGTGRILQNSDPECKIRHNSHLSRSEVTCGLELLRSWKLAWRPSVLRRGVGSWFRLRVEPDMMVAWRQPIRKNIQSQTANQKQTVGSIINMVVKGILGVQLLTEQTKPNPGRIY